LGLARWLRSWAAGRPVLCMGLEFPNAVGVAAGLDKNADYFESLGDLGFGCVEVGTVTPRPQPGNPRPRVFRLPQARALINRLGFNSKGVDYLVERVRKHRFKGVLGINIGKNFDTPLQRAGEDYRHCLEKVYPHADYVTVNISSPNTTGLRSLQSAGALNVLLGDLATQRRKLMDTHGRRVPIAIKVAPDSAIGYRGNGWHHQSSVWMQSSLPATLSRDGVQGMGMPTKGGLSEAVESPRRCRMQAFRRELPETSP
jgi:dihydroorotate dehydrogenase